MTNLRFMILTTSLQGKYKRSSPTHHPLYDVNRCFQDCLQINGSDITILTPGEITSQFSRPPHSYLAHFCPDKNSWEDNPSVFGNIKDS